MAYVRKKCKRAKALKEHGNARGKYKMSLRY